MMYTNTHKLHILQVVNAYVSLFTHPHFRILKFHNFLTDGLNFQCVKPAIITFSLLAWKMCGKVPFHKFGYLSKYLYFRLIMGTGEVRKVP